MSKYEILPIDEKTYRISEGGVWAFLLLGEEKALMIDSCMTIEGIKDIAKTLTDLPIELINTHADIDHVGANKEFDWFYMSPADASNYYKQQKGTGTLVPVWDNQIIDLGGRPLKIITTPGHTPGSITILDINRRVIYSGDPIQDGNVFMFGVMRDMHAYLLSLEKLWAMKDEFDQIYPSHCTFPLEPSIIEPLMEGAKNVLNGTAKGEKVVVHGTEVMCYDVAGVAGFLCDL